MGDEMLKSINIIFNKILKEQQVPTQWSQMNIKTMHKKGSKLEMKNKRGIFLTNIISKLFEKVINMKTEDEIVYNQYQSGARKNRSTTDNLFILHSVIQKYKFKKGYTFNICRCYQVF